MLTLNKPKIDRPQFLDRDWVLGDPLTFYELNLDIAAQISCQLDGKEIFDDAHPLTMEGAFGALATSLEGGRLLYSDDIVVITDDSHKEQDVTARVVIVCAPLDRIVRIGSIHCEALFILGNVVVVDKEIAAGYHAIIMAEKVYARKLNVGDSFIACQHLSTKEPSSNSFFGDNTQLWGSWSKETTNEPYDRDACMLIWANQIVPKLLARGLIDEVTSKIMLGIPFASAEELTLPPELTQCDPAPSKTDACVAEARDELAAEERADLRKLPNKYLKQILLNLKLPVSTENGEGSKKVFLGQIETVLSLDMMRDVVLKEIRMALRQYYAEVAQPVTTDIDQA